MLEPAQEPRTGNPMLLTKNFFFQKRGMSVKMQFAACRNIGARRNHGTFGQAYFRPFLFVDNVFVL